MQRREFLKTLASGMAAGWACHCWPTAWPFPGAATAATPALVIAGLADAHLKDGNARRPEARALARAVAEIRSLAPAPHLALFAGDLAHDGNPEALALGREILSDLAMPVLAVRGEGDGRQAPDGAGGQFFQTGRFFFTLEGMNLLGLDTVWQEGPGLGGFSLGESQSRWLNGVLDHLSPAAPLVILSHAPLTPIHRPWGQWTIDSGPLIERLSRFGHVLCLHGHVHQSGGLSSHRQIGPGTPPPPLVGGGWGEGEIFPLLGENLAQFTPSLTLPHQGGGEERFSWSGIQHISLPATSWPLPSALTGTPRQLRPGLGPRGCGWAQLQTGGPKPQVCQVVWQA
jgi:hypothetical protein